MTSFNKKAIISPIFNLFSLTDSGGFFLRRRNIFFPLTQELLLLRLFDALGTHIIRWLINAESRMIKHPFRKTTLRSLYKIFGNIIYSMLRAIEIFFPFTEFALFAYLPESNLFATQRVKFICQLTTKIVGS